MRAPPWPHEKSTRAFCLRLDGLTYAEIAREMGISRSSVAAYLTRHGIEPSRANTILTRPSRNDCNSGTFPFEVPKRRPNDDRLHLTLLLQALTQDRAGRVA